jgi:hypothetical protein
MKHPELPAEHCANQSPDKVMKMFVHNIAPELKSGSINARSAISQLEVWRKYHPEVFADWETLCWTYVQQPPEWVDWLIKGVTATSDTVTKADDLVAAAQVAATQALAHDGEIGNGRVSSLANGQPTLSSKLSSNSQERILRRIARDFPELLNDVGKDKRLKSARAAAIEAGIITPFPSLQLKDPAPTAQKLLAKKGKAWCLQLLEELSGLLEEPVSE